MAQLPGDRWIAACGKSELGWLVAAFYENRLARVAWGHASQRAAFGALAEAAPGAWSMTETAGEPAVQLVERLQRFLAGQWDDFADVPLDIQQDTPFTQEVLAACRNIAPGATRSYAELAAAVGRPRAARAVGNVMRTNRFPLVVPCHRVLGSSGGLGGYSAPGGLDTKRLLLRLEQKFVDGHETNTSNRAATVVRLVECAGA